MLAVISTKKHHSYEAVRWFQHMTNRELDNPMLKKPLEDAKRAAQLLDKDLEREGKEEKGMKETKEKSSQGT